eukprot:1763989-Pleurochrysis_carterae.AAC.2
MYAFICSFEADEYVTEDASKRKTPSRGRLATSKVTDITKSARCRGITNFSRNMTGAMMARAVPSSSRSSREPWLYAKKKVVLKNKLTSTPKMISKAYSCLSPPRLPATWRRVVKWRPPSAGWRLHSKLYKALNRSTGTGETLTTIQDWACFIRTTFLRASLPTYCATALWPC